MPAMSQLALQRQLHQFFGWWGHVFEALPERHHRETSILKVLAHLDRTPPVESDLSDIKPGAKILNELLDIPVVHHVALGRLQEALTVPQVVGDVIPRNSEFEVVFGNLKPGRDRVFVIVIRGWEYENESSDIGGGCQVEPAVTNPALQLR